MEKSPGIHPNAVVVLILGAVIAIFLAGRYEAILVGELFFAVTAVVAFVVNWLQRRSKR